VSWHETRVTRSPGAVNPAADTGDLAGDALIVLADTRELAGDALISVPLDTLVSAQPRVASQ
jgi:hypothetical protein